jgi:hypothetical protein
MFFLWGINKIKPDNMKDEFTGKEKIEKEDIFDSDEIEIETTSRTEYISSAYYAIAAVSELDTELMGEEDKRRKKNIVRKSLRIIDNIISELDGELFDEFEEDDEE